MAAFIEVLRRLGSATAEAAAGFLFSEDTGASREQEENQEEQHENVLDVPADSGEVKDLEQVRDSPLDAICEQVTESMDAVGEGHDHEGQGFPVTRDPSSQEESMDHAR